MLDRYQANQLPLVSRASIDTTKFAGMQTKYMPQLDDIPRSTDNFHPTSNWIDALLKSFSDLRLLIASLKRHENGRIISVPPLKDGAGWIRFCLGPRKDDGDSSHYLRKRKLACAQLAGLVVDVSSDDDSDYGEATIISNSNSFGNAAHKPTMSLILQFDQVLVQKLLVYHIKFLQKRY